MIMSRYRLRETVVACYSCDEKEVSCFRWRAVGSTCIQRPNLATGAGHRRSFMETGNWTDLGLANDTPNTIQNATNTIQNTTDNVTAPAHILRVWPIEELLVAAVAENIEIMGKHPLQLCESLCRKNIGGASHNAECSHFYFHERVGCTTFSSSGRDQTRLIRGSDRFRTGFRPVSDRFLSSQSDQCQTSAMPDATQSMSQSLFSPKHSPCHHVLSDLRSPVGCTGVLTEIHVYHTESGSIFVGQPVR